MTGADDFCHLMVRDGVLTPSAATSAHRRALVYGEPLDVALLAAGVSEDVLTPYLAAAYGIPSLPKDPRELPLSPERLFAAPVLPNPRGAGLQLGDVDHPILVLGLRRPRPNFAQPARPKPRRDHRGRTPRRPSKPQRPACPENRGATARAAETTVTKTKRSPCVTARQTAPGWRNLSHLSRPRAGLTRFGPSRRGAISPPQKPGRWVLMPR